MISRLSLENRFFIRQSVSSTSKLIFSCFTIVLVFQLISSQTAPQPPVLSDNCQNWNNNLTVCQQCNEGFYLQYFICISCNPRCICNSAKDYCQSCYVVQYDNLNFVSYLDPIQNQCILCNSTMPYCLQCDNQFLCTKCWNGYYIVQQKDIHNIVTKQYCSQNSCTQNCMICEDNQHCKQCQPGFFLYTNKTCSLNQCSNNCSICASISQCQQCATGYYLNVPKSGNPTCQVCMANCTQCTSATNCIQCAPQYYVQNNSCVNSGLGNCVQYTNSFQTCSGCQAGYQITLGTCYQCIGCQICTQQFICLTPCLPGYQPFNFACIPSYQFKFKFGLFFLIIFFFILL